MPGFNPVYHSSPRMYQRGRGIGSIFSGLWRFIKPLFLPSLKTAGCVAKTSAVRIAKSSAVKKGISKAKSRAIKAGINVAANTLAGRDVKEGLKEDISAAGEEAGDTVGELVKELAGGVGQKKRKRKPKTKKAPSSRTLSAVPKRAAKKRKAVTTSVFEDK